MKLIFTAFCCLMTATLATVAGGGQGLSTNGAAAKDAASTNEPPKPPGDNFTNSVDMELVKVGGFWAGKYEVTQKEFRKIMGYNPSATMGERLPVDSVTWQDAMSFCQKMTESDVKEKKLPEGYSYVLPTESEWEGLVAGQDMKDAVTSRGGKFRASPAPVGSLSPNGLGLYDVRGNVSEFCLGDTSKPYRVLRGGSFADWIEVNLRLEFRTYCKPDETKNTFGFRVLLKGK